MRRTKKNLPQTLHNLTDESLHWDVCANGTFPRAAEKVSITRLNPITIEMNVDEFTFLFYWCFGHRIALALRKTVQICLNKHLISSQNHVIRLRLFSHIWKDVFEFICVNKVTVLFCVYSIAGAFHYIIPECQRQQVWSPKPYFLRHRPLVEALPAWYCRCEGNQILFFVHCNA